MTFERFKPDPGLGSTIESILVVRSEEGFTHTLPPNTAPVLAFRLSGVTAQVSPHGETPLPRLALTGVNHAPRVIRYHPGASMLLVRFREGAASGLTDAPLHEIARATLSLDTLMDPARAHELEDRLGTSEGQERLRVVNDFLLAAISGDQGDALVEQTIQRIRGSKGTIGVRALVGDLATNLDSLEKRFRRCVGVSPKRFARMVRFQHFVDTYDPETNLADAAARAGYYDQAHLVREFQDFTGQSPSVYLSTPRRW